MSLARQTLLAAVALAQLAGAIDLTNPLDGCPSDAHLIASGYNVFNSTGETSFRPKGQSDDWYLSMTFRDQRAKNAIYNRLPTSQSLGVIVSVPGSFPKSTEGKQTGLCIYRFQQQNTTANGQASCSGILSDECIKALTSVPATSDGSCPVPVVSGACGDLPIDASSFHPIYFNNTLCSTNATVPGADKIPDGYQNYITTASADTNNTDDSRGSYKEYSEHILRPAPILITTKFGGIGNSTEPATSDAQLFCLAPSKVAAGSKAAPVKGSDATLAASLGKPVLLVTVISCMMAVAL